MAASFQGRREASGWQEARRLLIERRYRKRASSVKAGCYPRAAMESGDAPAREHLEMIQAVINRMGSNSFAVKTWTVGLVAALLTFAAEREETASRVLVALMPVAVFWYLDAFYLRQERLFRRLYDAVRLGEDSAVQGGPFTMSAKPYESERYNRLWAVLWSRSIAPLYVSLVVIVLAAYAYKTKS
jgi:hypothetical protein